jgi:secreted Zn-dependent insulinase-like peptidase
MRMELTQAGQADVPAVLSVIFGYLRLLREGGGVDAGIYEESRSLSALRWAPGWAPGWGPACCMAAGSALGQ